MGLSTEDPEVPYEHRHWSDGRDLRAPDHRKPWVCGDSRNSWKSGVHWST